MRKTFFSLALLISTTILYGCNFKINDSSEREFQKSLDDQKKKNDEVIDILKKSMVQGGQPGAIQVSGVIIKDNSILDERITVSLKGGKGQDGSEVQLSEASKLSLSSVVENLNMSSLSNKKALISLGCDNSFVTSFATHHSLEVQQAPNFSPNEKIEITASTVILCNNLNDIFYGQILVVADQLILNNVNYTLEHASASSVVASFITLTANKLVLIGPNQLKTKGVDSTQPRLSLTAKINLTVQKEIFSSEDGSLALISEGSDFKAKEKD